VYHLYISCIVFFLSFFYLFLVVTIR
jgi:hypothetical protein